MTMRAALIALVAAAGLGAGAAFAQTDGAEDTADTAAPASETGQGMMGGQGKGHRGQGMKGRHGDHGMSRHRGGGMMGRHHAKGTKGSGMGHRAMHARHHGRGGDRAPTLRIETEGHGSSIEFECRAEMAACLEAIDRVYEAAGTARRGRGEGMRRGMGGQSN